MRRKRHQRVNIQESREQNPVQPPKEERLCPEKNAGNEEAAVPETAGVQELNSPPVPDSSAGTVPSCNTVIPEKVAQEKPVKHKISVVELVIKIILLLMTAVCMAGILYSVLTKHSASGNANKPVKTPSSGQNGTVITVNAVTIEPETMTQTVKLNGDVTSRSEISLYADTSGKLVSYTVSVGSTVEQGDVVAYVDPSKPGASYSVNPVRSTIAGTIISLPYARGDTLSSTSPVATVGNLNDLQIIAYASEKYASILKVGASAKISLVAYPERTFYAYVSQVSPVVDLSSRSIEIRLNISPVRREIKPGMFAGITLVTRQITNSKIIPKAALRTYDDKTVVYVVDSEKHARRVEVSTGLSNDTHIQIVSGIEFGDIVITSGSVTDGTPVRIAGEEEPSKDEGSA